MCSQNGHAIVAMFQMKIIQLDLTLRTITFTSQVQKVPSALNVICHIKHTWALMIAVIIV